MTRIRWIKLRRAVAAVGLVVGWTFASAQQSPAFLLEPMLDTYFDDRSGLIQFDAYELAFPPDEPLQAVLAVVDDSNTVVQSFPFRNSYGNRTGNGALARAVLERPAEITLTEPGVYNLAFLIDGELVSRLPVVLEKVQVGDDPFDAETVYRYYGLWQVFAHITMDTWSGEDWPVLTFWAGMRDFAEPAHQLRFFAELRRDGELVAHSKRTQGSIPYRHYDRIEAHFYHPHDRGGSASARPFMADDWMQDGDYEITIRREDGAVLRTFHYTASNGAIEPLPRTRIGHEPALDYIPPRVRDKSSTGYDFVEAIWITQRD